jgi:hypothetical protein
LRPHKAGDAGRLLSITWENQVPPGVNRAQTFVCCGAKSRDEMAGGVAPNRAMGWRAASRQIIWLLPPYLLIGAAPRPNCHQHAGISKQAALF